MLEFRWEGLDEAFVALEKQCGDVVRGITVEAWNRVLQQTPQHYGRAVASWTYSIGAPVFVDRSEDVDAEGHLWPEDGPFRGKGNATAIGVANSFNLGAQGAFKLGDTVWFANGVDHGEGPYAAGLESGTVPLRAVNRPGQMVSRTLDYLQTKYASGVSPASAARLAQLNIGF